MFGLSKKEKILSIERKIENLKKNALIFYNYKSDVEETAFRDLLSLSVKNKISPDAAAKTEEGIEILSEIVLNRQYAFYLNEQAIQLYSELYRIKNGKLPSTSKKGWLYEVVKSSGWEIIMQELPAMSQHIINEVKDEIENRNLACQ